jgi:hypothetical protein
MLKRHDFLSLSFKKIKNEREEKAFRLKSASQIRTAALEERFTRRALHKYGPLRLKSVSLEERCA